MERNVRTHSVTPYSPNEYINRGLSGLENLGNTCYMNSILQCLSNTLPLTHFLLQAGKVDSFEQMHKDKREYALVREYIKLLNGLWEENYPVTPVSFRKLFGKMFAAFQGPTQQDSQECLAFLLDTVHQGISSKVGNRNQSATRKSRSLGKIADNTWNKFYENNYSLIVDLFYGQFHARTGCPECGYFGHTFDPFCFLSLPIPLDQGSVNLQMCLSKYFSGETLDSENLWKCENEKCQQKVKAARNLCFWKLPEILIIQLKRFKTSIKQMGNQQMLQMEKIVAPIDFPMTSLDLSHFTDPGSTDKTIKNRGTKYELYAVSNHTGGIRGGHYFSYCKNANGRWYEFNDLAVKEIPSMSVVTSNAYILFYQRVYKR